MTKRLQVMLKDPDYREIQKMARARHLSIAEWVRQALNAARKREPLGDVGKKLDAVRAAVANQFPTADIDVMLAQIEAGYGVAERRPERRPEQRPEQR